MELSLMQHSLRPNPGGRGRGGLPTLYRLNRRVNPGVDGNTR
jgi:hypothetical protein